MDPTVSLSQQTAQNLFLYLVEELFSSGARLDGEFQLCIHGSHTDIYLQMETNSE